MTDSDQICPWELLGVSPRDDRATIRRAWRALVRQYHPDLAGTDRETANRKLAEINAAYDIVWDSDAGRRKLEEDRRKAEASRRAEAERRAEAARKAEAERRAQAAKRVRAERADAVRVPVARPTGWSRADRLAARTARLAFDRARRILEGPPAPLRPAVYR